MFQRPYERYIGDSSTPAVQKSSKNHAAARVFNDTPNGNFKPGVGYLDVVLPQLCREQPQDGGKMFR